MKKEQQQLGRRNTCTPTNVSLVCSPVVLTLKFATEDRVRQFGFVEDAIPKLLEQGIHADLILKWDRPTDVETFFKNFFKKESFEDALDVDFGEFLKQFTFETDNDAVPAMNMLDKLIKVTLPLDKADYTDETLFNTLKELYNSKKEKLE